MRYAEFTKAFFIVKYQDVLWYTNNCNSIYARNECSDFYVAIINTKRTDIQLSLHANLSSILQISWLINFENACNNSFMSLSKTSISLRRFSRNIFCLILVDIFYQNRIRNIEKMGKRLLTSTRKASFHCIDFYDTGSCSTAFCVDHLYQIVYKPDKRTGKGRWVIFTLM
jgi:hypothetical protein